MSGLLEGITIYFVPAEPADRSGETPQIVEKYREYGATVLQRTPFDVQLPGTDPATQIAEVDQYLEQLTEDMAAASYVVFDMPPGYASQTLMQIHRRSLEMATARRLAEQRNQEGSLGWLGAIALIRGDRRDDWPQFTLAIPGGEVRYYSTPLHILDTARTMATHRRAARRVTSSTYPRAS